MFIVICFFAIFVLFILAGGDIAGGAPKKLEERLGRPIVTKENFLKSAEGKKSLKK